MVRPPTTSSFPPSSSEQWALLMQAVMSSSSSQGAFQALAMMVEQEVGALLAGILDSRVASVGGLGPDVVAMVDAIRSLTLRGGKRLRPVLVMVGYAAGGARLPLRPALEAGAAMELLQSYLLIHDDWMDQDETRRGGPSVPVMLRRVHGSEHEGDSAAILAGDYASAMALDVLSHVDVAPEDLISALRLFAQIQLDVICGQQLDVAAVTDVETAYPLKTGSYTIRGPLLLGAELAGVSSHIMGVLERFAHPVGIAFQMQDDLLGVFGDSAKTGKPVGEDLRRGALTSVVQHARICLSERELVMLDAIFGNRTASVEQVREVTAMLDSSGVRARVQRRIADHVESALASLEDPSVDPMTKRWLAGFCEVLVSRSR